MPATNFVAEAWSYLAIDLVIVAIRLGTRWHTLGLRGLAPDDYLMTAAAFLYTAETALAYYVGAYWFGLANNSMTPEQRASLDPNSIEYYRRVHGSQTELTGWLVYATLLWTLKLCWLFLYSRLGEGVHNMRLKVRIGFIVVPISFVVTFVVVLCACWPIEKHWQINPDPGDICQPAVAKVSAYTLITMNLSTDFYIMSIPLPMVWGTRMDIKKKIGLLVMFCAGIFTAVAGLLRCVLILTSGADGPEQAGEWSCRESFIAVLVSNVPFIYPPLRRAFKRLTGQPTTTGEDTKSRSKSYQLGNFTISSKKNKKFKHPLSMPDETVMQRTAYERYGSDEMIVIPEEEEAVGGIGQSKINDSASDAHSSVKGGDIRVTTRWEVQSDSDERTKTHNFEKERHTRMFSQTKSR
ncbi:hypothetical protein F5884DRAFT_347824 [Xylogone sp. PMI_703]|nr:hypothetical protein F5884DRAFT_347824 [Xylogone sp. PMI_703]